MSIDILLINPPFRLIPPFEYKLIDPPRNLALLAAFLISKGHTVKILDMPILEQDFTSLIPEIEKAQPKIIGISNRSTYSFPIVQKVASTIKQHYPSIQIIVGGTYVSFAPVEALQQEPALDVIVIGEGEETLFHLVSKIVRGECIDQIKGIAFRNVLGTIVRNEEAPVLEDLTILPAPAVDLLPIQKYVARNERYILDISRGCIYNCDYCTSSYIKNHIRYRSKKTVIKEIVTAYELGFRNFYFFDDIFTANKNLVIDICREIVERGIKILWPCMTRIDLINDEILSWMKKAGCTLIAYGIESTSEAYLKEIGKHDQLQRVEAIFDKTREHGIRPLAFVIFGLPKTKFHEEFETIRFLSKISPEAVGVFSFKPYPGTKYYNQPEKNGITIIDNNFSFWSQLDEPTHETEFLSKNEIIEAMIVCNYLFRSGGTFSRGIKYRRRKGVQVLKTGEGGLLYNPYLAPEMRKTDMYLNCIKLDYEYFEIIYRCDGYHSMDDITLIMEKQFQLENPRERINEVIGKALDMHLIEEVIDVMHNMSSTETKALVYGGGLI
jgi:anaerobic magnesium-protoporphyrin IX monomethyl ester cyclase